jgi:hypothetical protein
MSFNDLSKRKESVEKDAKPAGAEAKPIDQRAEPETPGTQKQNA